MNPLLTTQRWTPGVLVCLGLWLTPVGRGTGQGSAGFKNLERGKVVASLEASELIGTKTKVYFSTGTPTILAFLRQEQEGSNQVFEVIQKVAADERDTGLKIAVMATGKRTNLWLGKARDLPRGMEVYLDDRGASAKVGVRVTPCLAVMDGKGRLCETFLLYDKGLEGKIKKALVEIARRKGAPPPAADPKLIQYQELDELAMALASLSKFKEALAIREKQLELGIHEPRVRVEIARILLQLGRGRWALDHLRTSLETEDRLPTRVLLGKALLMSGELREAKKELVGLVDLNPNKAEVLWLLSQVAKRQGKVDEAIDYVKQAIHALNMRRGKDDSK